MKKLVLVLATMSLLAAGCGGAGEESTEVEDAAPSTERYVPGPFFGECGSVTDDEVVSAFGLGPFTSVTRNSVGCQWEISGFSGPSVSFSWYRGSPIGRERAGSELLGRPAQDITIDGNPGFEASLRDSLCEIGVQFGDDFMHWSVSYSDSPAARPPCDVGNELAELVVERAQ